MIRSLFAALCALTLAGCGAGANSVGFSTRVGPLTGTTGQGLARQGLTASDLVLERVRIVVRAIELERGDEQNEVELEAGPYLVDLTGAELGGGVSRQFTIDAPAGTYDELEFEIHKLSDGEQVTDAELLAMRALNASIAIDGKIAGEAFSFVSEVDEKQEHQGSFDVGGGAGNVTLNLDSSQWLSDGAGGTLDPRNPDHRSKIEQNIKSSIRPFDDDDSDGDDDAAEEAETDAGNP